MLLVQLRVGTRDGVRMEMIHISEEGRAAEHLRVGCLVLHAANQFRSGCARVRTWGVEQCRVTEVDAKRFRMPLQRMEEAEYDGGSSSCSGDEAAEAEGSTKKRRRRTPSHHDPRKPRKKKTVSKRAGGGGGGRRRQAEAEAEAEAEEGGGWLELDMPDEEGGHAVGYVWLMLLSPTPSNAGGGGGGSRTDVPHPGHAFRIENTCGACRTPHEPLNLRLLHRLRTARGATGDLITTLSGTFAPCTNRVQVDFRGVRSIREMQSDWELVSGVPSVRTDVTLYMLVLKACLGLPVLLVDYGAIPEGLGEEGEGARIAAEGRGRCYLARRMAPWCEGFTQHVDVCQGIELLGIRWDRLVPTACAPLRLARSSAHVSRRGGVMLRLIFPRNTPWGVGEETAVVTDCNALLDVLRRALTGRSL
jgi:hypothetical protein